MKQRIAITGTSRGIGAYLAQYYLDSGHRVYGCSRSEGTIEHENYTHVALDVHDEAAARLFFAKIRKEAGGIDVMINNAGIASMNHILLTPTKVFERILRTNTVGTFIFMREAAKLMSTSGGRIINFTSVAVPLCLEGEAVYAASKAAIESLTRIAAREFAEMNITVNAIGPTPIDTDLVRSVPKEKMLALTSRQAIQRYGEFSDVTNCVDFLIRPESNFITGQILYFGGL